MLDIISKVLIFPLGLLEFYLIIKFVIHATRGFTTRRQNGRINKVELLKSVCCYVIAMDLYLLPYLLQTPIDFDKNILNLCGILFILIIFITSCTIYCCLPWPDRFKLISHVKVKWRKALTIIYLVSAFISFYVALFIASPAFNRAGGV